MVELTLGKREQISMKEETDYGDAVTPTLIMGREAIWEPNNLENWIELRGADSNDVNVDDMEIGMKTVGGTLTFAPQDWIFMKYILCDGSSDIADTEPAAYYLHTFTNAVDVGSFTLQRAQQLTALDDHVVTYDGCQVDKCSMSWDSSGGDALLKVALTVLAQDLTAGTTTTSIAGATTSAFQFRNVVLTLNDSEVTEHVGGTFNIENNLNPARYSNYTLDRTKGESAPTIRRFNGSFRIRVKSDAYFDFWDTDAVIDDCKLKFERGTNDLAEFTFVNFRIENAPDPTNLDGINTVTINWTAEDATLTAQDAIGVY